MVTDFLLECVLLNGLVGVYPTQQILSYHNNIYIYIWFTLLTIIMYTIADKESDNKLFIP